jgi:ABC-2 type transport system permease protein
VVKGLIDYGVLVAMWTRASWQYRSSVVLSTLFQAIMSAIDLLVVLIIFYQTKSLAGFSFAQVLFFYGTAFSAFGISNLAIGNVDQLGQQIRKGSFDAILMRPASALAQVAAENFSITRAGLLLQGLIALAVSLALLQTPLTPLKGLLLALSILLGAIIMSGVRIAVAALLFIAHDAAEVINSLSYGGNVLTQYPLAIYGRDVVAFLIWVIPLAFVNWLPGLYILGVPDPLHFPMALQFSAPAAAAASLLVAGSAWRLGLRHYKSSGS